MTSGLNTGVSPFVSVVLCAQKKLKIEVLTHNIRVGSAAVEIIGGIDQLILPNRFVGEDKVILVDKDEIDVAVPMIGELCEDVELLVPGTRVSGNNGEIDVAIRVRMPGRR
jgi:hypothetical protein